jgi:hypothetical protein
MKDAGAVHELKSFRGGKPKMSLGGVVFSV